MTRERPLFTSRAGATHAWRDDGRGGGVVVSTTDVTPMLERNKQMANANDGYSPSRELRRVASIPFAIVHKILAEEGIDILDPRHSDRLVKLLNDPDFAHLRTAPGRVALSGGDGFR
ncbi:MAG TPA: hypothetical protein VGL66_06485 [Caulobacteraceae bacterium]|jgi:hypothetical protein